MPLLEPGIEFGLLLGDRQGAAQAGLVPGEGAFAEAGQDEEAEVAPVAQQVQVGHGLAQLVFRVDVLDQVGLVDDIDQMARFGDAPEDLADAE